jgi:hypothetical protein
MLSSEKTQALKVTTISDRPSVSTERGSATAGNKPFGFPLLDNNLKMAILRQSDRLKQKLF